MQGTMLRPVRSPPAATLYTVSCRGAREVSSTVIAASRRITGNDRLDVDVDGQGGCARHTPTRIQQLRKFYTNRKKNL